MIDSNRRRFRFLVSRGNAARDERRYAAAAALYEEALRLQPDAAAIRIQCGHMHKEAGRLVEAGAHYDRALLARPDDPDLALQLGHFHKRAGRPAETRAAYARALALRPDWQAAESELRAFDRQLAGSAGDVNEPADAIPAADLAEHSAADLVRLNLGLVPRLAALLVHSHREEIAIRRLGRREITFWGERTTLCGVEAVRGFVVSETAVTEIDVFVNGLRIHHGPLAGGYTLALEQYPQRIKKYVFNAWVDLSSFGHALHRLEIRFTDANGRTRSHHEDVVIGPPPAEADWPQSDFVITPDPLSGRSLEEQVRDRPSMIRPAARALFPAGVARILVMRMDQLGDMVASVPALQRLRELFPDTHIVGLFTPANAELARTLGLLDEIVVAAFPDDRAERRRVMPLADQEALRRRLESYGFDIAIDLAQSGASRELLRLAGARFTHGTGGGGLPWLSSEFSMNTHDPWTRHDCTPHSTKVMALVEALGSIVQPRHVVLRRDDLSRAALHGYGILPEDRFAVVHTGARISFSQWPHYGRLIAEILARTDLKVVMINDNPRMRDTLPPAAAADPRLHVVDGQIAFDDFDALLSFAAVVIGNDSGPKHLASLRGTPIVTLFSARINWTEWGQENVGTIISRKVPCAGCAILHDPEECGRDFACVRDIRVEEVFDAMTAELAKAGAAAA